MQHFNGLALLAIMVLTYGLVNLPREPKKIDCTKLHTKFLTWHQSE